MRPVQKFLRVSDLPMRWGGVSRMFVERRILNDPAFPQIIRLGAQGRTRLVDVDELEQYERMSMGRRVADARPRNKAGRFAASETEVA